MTYTLEVQNRESKKARALRREGFVPGTVYGAGIEPVAFSFLLKTYSKYLSLIIEELLSLTDLVRSMKLLSSMYRRTF